MSAHPSGFSLRHLSALQRSEQTGSKSGYNLQPLRSLFDAPKMEKPWLVKDLLPLGGLSALVSKPKVGKSTLARQLALAVATGHKFLDRRVAEGTVVYLALEEKLDEVERHFRDLGASGNEPIYIHCAPAPADAMEKLKVTLSEHPAQLIIIDTLFKFARVRDANDYAVVTAALEPVLTLARSTGAHVLVLHHAGKSERSEPGDSILGSTAILGNVDTALFLGRRGAQRTISSSQRYGQDLPETVLSFDAKRRATTLGKTYEQAEEEAVEDEIYTFVAAHPNVSESEILSGVEGRRQRKVTALRALLGTRLERQGRGGKADPFRYSASEAVGATTTAIVCCSENLVGTSGTRTEKSSQTTEIIGEILVPASREHEPELQYLWEQEHSAAAVDEGGVLYDPTD